MLEFTEADLSKPALALATKAEIQDRIDSLRELARKTLRGRERDILQSFEDYLQKHGGLTEKQYETLLSIHAQHLGED